jgi:hypothetical protein
MALVAIIKGLQVIPAGSEVTIVTESPSAITVIYNNNPKLTHDALIHLHRNRLRCLKPGFGYVSGPSGHLEHDWVDTLASMLRKGNRIGSGHALVADRHPLGCERGGMSREANVSGSRPKSSEGKEAIDHVTEAKPPPCLDRLGAADRRVHPGP